MANFHQKLDSLGYSVPIHEHFVRRDVVYGTMRECISAFRGDAEDLDCVRSLSLVDVRGKPFLVVVR